MSACNTPECFCCLVTRWMVSNAPQKPGEKDAAGNRKPERSAVSLGSLVLRDLPEPSELKLCCWFSDSGLGWLL